MELQLDSGGVRLRAVLVGSHSAGPTRGLVLCHAAPPAPSFAADSSFEELATSLSANTGWTVLTFDFRSTDPTRVAVGKWRADLRAAIDYLATRDELEGVWLAGFSVGGALAICAGGEDETIRGVASFGAPAAFDSWAVDDPTIRPMQLISKLPPRPVMLVHGDSDEIVGSVDARALADAAGGEVELRILTGGGHGLRHDPRATALLEGWMDRQKL